MTLTLSPPWEGGASAVEEEKENEAAPALKTETGDRKEGEDRSNRIVGKPEGDACLVMIMERTIAEEVRKYIDSLWAQNNRPGPNLTVRKDP